MNLPSLPTDNLYKFMALSGVLLILVSYIIPTSRIAEIRLKIVESTTQQKVLEAEMVALDNEIDDVGKIHEPSAAQISRIKERHLQNRIKRIQIEGQADKILFLVEQMERERVTFLLGAIVGILLANFGFYFWYQRVQKPSDLLTKRQVES